MKQNSRYNSGLIYASVNATKGVTDKVSVYNTYGIPTTRQTFVKTLYHEKRFKVIWFSFIILSLIACLIISPSSYLYCAELLITALSIHLIGEAKLIGQVFALIECFLYAYISYKNKLFGESIKSLCINLPLITFALISWSKSFKKQGNKGIKINELTPKKWAIIGLVFVVLCVACYFLLGLIGTSVLVLSSITFSISVVCKYLTAKAYKESWFLTIIQSVIAFSLWVYMFIENILLNSADLATLPILFMYMAIMSNAVYSFILWQAMFKKEKKPTGQLFAMREIKVNKIIKLRKRYSNLYWDKKVDISKNS
ncbi:MAG: nicotinamide riboside transporter PnuC [bacterium]|nr:nicotinamide riboside transporter PnuC [bacterium]